LVDTNANLKTGEIIMFKTLIKTSLVFLLSISFANAADLYGTLKKIKDKLF